jgi:2-dehydro-3-deoxyphosphooctonate aldolase (KDO 8-P synthase)
MLVMGRAAQAVGVRGLFIETHPDPSNAKCDGHRSLQLKDLRHLLTSIFRK